MIESQLPVIIILLPFAAALMSSIMVFFDTYLRNTYFENLFKCFSFIFLINIVLSCYLFKLCQSHTFVTTHLASWSTSVGIGLKANLIYACFAILINTIAFIVSIFAWKRWSEINFSLFCVLAASFLGLLFSNDLFNIYVFIEVSALSAYALLASGGNKATIAVFKYLSLGVIAATFYLLGLAIFYSQTGYLNIDSAREFLIQNSSHLNIKLIQASLICFLIGLAIKTALFPMHTWMPGVYTYAPSYLVAFISSLMTKMNLIIFFKIFFLLAPALYIPDFMWLSIQVLAIASMLYGSIMAYYTPDARRMFAFSSISHIGLIYLAFSTQSLIGILAAFFHIFCHALMKTNFFLISEQVISEKKHQNISDFQSLSKQSKLLALIVVITGASMVGLPPFAGFISKFLLLLQSIELGNWYIAIILIISAVLTSLYIFKFIQNCFHNNEYNSKEKTKPVNMVQKICLITLTLCLLSSFPLLLTFKNHLLNKIENIVQNKIVFEKNSSQNQTILKGL